MQWKFDPFQVSFYLTGDMDGPSSATNNAVVVFDGTTGKKSKNSPVIIDGSGNMSGVGTFSCAGVATLGSSTAATHKNFVHVAYANVFQVRNDNDDANSVFQMRVPATSSKFPIIQFSRSASSLWSMAVDAGNILKFAFNSSGDPSSGVMIQSTSAGALTFGPDNFTGSHAANCRSLGIVNTEGYAAQLILQASGGTGTPKNWSLESVGSGRGVSSAGSFILRNTSDGITVFEAASSGDTYIGPSSSNAARVLTNYGSIILAGSGTTSIPSFSSNILKYVGNRTNMLLMRTDNTEADIYLYSNLYWDGTNTFKSLANRVAGIFQINGTNQTTTGDLFNFYADKNLNAAGSAATIRKIAVADANGLWSFGVSTEANQGIKLLGNDSGYTASALKYYQESGEGTLGTLTWTGATAPTESSKKYRWTRMGNRVDFQFEIQTSGGATKSVNFELPAGSPSPVGMSNLGTNRWHAIGFGYFGNGDAGGLTHGGAGAGCGLYRDSGGGHKVYCYRSTEVDTGNANVKGQFVYYAA